MGLFIFVENMWQNYSFFTHPYSSIIYSVYGFQARAPNSPVIIVGTHVDQVFSNPERFPSGYLEELNTVIRG